MRRRLSIVVTLFFFLVAHAQVDTEFWFAVPWLCSHCWMADYHLVIFAEDQAAKVTISMPADSTFTPVKLNIAANGYNDYILANDYYTAQDQLAVPFDEVSKKAIFVESNTPIYCYFQVTMHNGEAYTLKGRKALGTDFYILSQNTLNINYGDAYHSVQILATEDSTAISISPTHSVGAACSATPFTIVLNKGETYAFRNCSMSASEHLVGTYITANKPIAVNSSDDSVEYGGQDLAADQLTPTDHWGTEYIAVGNNATYETLTIVAKDDNTIVTVDDGSSLTLNKGEIGSVPMNNAASRYLQSNKPIGVWQLTGYYTEVGGTNLPGMGCTGSKVVKYMRSATTTQTIIHIVTETDNVPYFTMNGSPIATTDFQLVEGTNSNYSYASIDVTNMISGLIMVECSSGYFHMSAIDNTGTGGSIESCTYGYFSDYSAAHEYVEFDTIPEGATYTWRGHYEADGVTERTFTESGFYSDTFPSQEGCDSVRTLKLTVWHTYLGDTAVAFCSGGSFTWHGATYTSTGDYYHTYKSVVSGEDSIVTLHVTVLEPTDSLELATICDGETYTWHGQKFTEATTAIDTLVNAVGCDSICTLQLTVNPIVTGDTTATIIEGSSFTWWGTKYTTAGDYTHTYTSQSTGCDSVVTLHLTVQAAALSYEIHTYPQCADEAFVEFEITANKAIENVLFAFSQKAKEQHFRDTVVTSPKADIQIPNSAKAGIYDVAISLTDNSGTTDTRNCQFTLLYPSSVLDQHWDDLIGVLTYNYNGGYDFVGFQWYKDGTPLDGETHSYLYQPLEMGQAYSAMLEEADGTKLMTCELIAVPQTDISLYPTLAQPHQIIRLHNTQDVTVWLYNVHGVLIYTQSFSSGENQLTAPQEAGVYFMRIQPTAANGQTTHKKLLIK